MLDRYLLRHPSAVDILKNIFSNRLLINSRLYQSHVLKKANKYARKYPQGIKGVDIETTLNCNARCVMCYHSSKQLSGTMNMDLFRKIVDDCFDNGITTVGLSVYGEPLMDAYLFERIGYLRKYDMEYGFFTNGYLLDEKKASALLELGGLKKVNFSVCAYDKDIYERIMVGLKRDVTYKNILNFLSLKKKFRRDNLIVSISGVKLNANRKDMRKFVRFWQRQKGVDYVITADLWNRVGNGIADDIGKIGKMHSKDNRLTPCKQLWGSVYVYFDGRVAPCCDDSDLRGLIIGDMNKQTLREIYSSREIEDLRKLHLEDKRHCHEICGKCFHNSVWL